LTGSEVGSQHGSDLRPFACGDDTRLSEAAEEALQRRAIAEGTSVEDLVASAPRLVGDPPPIRDLGVLGSAAARPAPNAFGEDAYPDIWLETAALLQSLVGNRPLVDGNERPGWLSPPVFFELNGVDATQAENDDVHDFAMPVAAGQSSVEEITEGLRRTAG
jgi:death-on-curing protein